MGESALARTAGQPGSMSICPGRTAGSSQCRSFWKAVLGRCWPVRKMSVVWSGAEQRQGRPHQCFSDQPSLRNRENSLKTTRISALTTSNHNHLQEVMADASFPPFKHHRTSSLYGSKIADSHTRILGNVSSHLAKLTQYQTTTVCRFSSRHHIYLFKPF